jgi:hypothetical protein
MSANVDTAKENDKCHSQRRESQLRARQWLQSRCVGHCHQVSTGTVGRGLSLNESQGLHQALPLRGVIPSLAEMRCAPHWTLNSKYLDIRKIGLMNFGC